MVNGRRVTDHFHYTKASPGAKLDNMLSSGTNKEVITTQRLVQAISSEFYTIR